MGKLAGERGVRVEWAGAGMYQEEEDEEEGEQVQAGIEAEDARWRKHLQHARQSQGEYGGPEVVCLFCRRVGLVRVL